MVRFSEVVLAFVLCVGAHQLSSATAGQLDKFVHLRQIDGDENSVEVAGLISTVENLENMTISGQIRIRTIYPVNIVYCDSHSQLPVDNTATYVVDSSSDVRRFDFSLPANAAVLNTVLGSAGLRCTAYVNNHLRHFRIIYGADGGVRLLPNSTSTDLHNILNNVYRDSPHLLWIVFIMLILALVILIAIPVIVILNNRKIGL